MKMESEVRAIRFDDTGLFCFAGNKAGQLCVLEASDNATLTYKYKLDISRVRSMRPPALSHASLTPRLFGGIVG